MWQVIGRGFNGWHAERKNTSSSGGTLAGYLAEAADGAFIYDASEADYDKFASFVIAGPMLSLSADPDEVRKFNNKAPHIVEAFGMTAVAKLGGLDYIGLNVYKRLLAEIPGVKLGTVKGGEVVWE